MSRNEAMSVADILGEWVDPDFQSGLIERCKNGWYTPVTKLTNGLICTYLRQRIALSLILPEAKKRLAEGYTDDTELYEEELEIAIKEAEKSI